MRELNQSELYSVTGGMQAAEGESTTSWWDDFKSWVRTVWGELTGGGGWSGSNYPTPERTAQACYDLARGMDTVDSQWIKTIYSPDKIEGVCSNASSLTAKWQQGRVKQMCEEDGGTWNASKVICDP